MTEAHPCAITKELSHKLANMALICSFFVVFIHTGTECTDGDTTWWLMHLWKNGLCRIAVPFFFIASGFFLAGHCLEDGWWSRESQKRVRSLLMPYLIWCTAWVVYNLAIIVLANVLAGAELSRNFPFTTLSDWLNIYGIALSKYPYSIPLWYVRWLMILMLCSGAFVWILKQGQRVSRIYLVVLFLLAVYCGPLFHEHPVLQFASFRGLFFFNLGLYLRLYPPQVTLSRPTALGLLVAGMCVFAFELAGRVYGINWAQYVNRVAILLVLSGSWAFVPAKQWNSNLEACAFPIYLLHIFVLSFLSLLRKELALPYPSGLAEFALNGVIAIVGSIVVALFFRKFFPKTAAVFFGGR